MDSGLSQEFPETFSSSISSCVHRIRVEEADGGREWLWGECVHGCGFRREYRAWIDPFEGLDAGDYAHALIYGSANGNEVRDD